MGPSQSSSFPCAAPLHLACVLSCVKGREALPPGRRQRCIPGCGGEKWICYVQIRKRWFDLFHYLVKITQWCHCFQINLSGLQFSVLWGKCGSLKMRPPCVGKLGNYSLAWVVVFFFPFFLFPPTASQDSLVKCSERQRGCTHGSSFSSPHKGKALGFWCFVMHAT